jgi:uncharacterized protein (DUF58 family)
MRLNLRAFGVIAFAAVILYLAGVYFGGLFLALFWVLILFPLASILLLLVWFLTTRYIQSFSTLRPVKGQDIHYSLTIGNESIFPLLDVEVRFRTVGPLMSSILPPHRGYVQGGETMKKQYVIQCPYRGIYTIGLERIVLRDLLGLVELRPKATAETFYVYPRVLELRRFSSTTDSLESASEGDAAGGVPDYTLYNELREYRPGESIRHMAWRKYAATGRPFLKQYDSTAMPDVRIYADLRRSRLEGALRYEQEDAVVEILVALVRHFLGRGIAIAVSAPGPKVYEFSGDTPESFPEFYDSTVHLEFQDTVSPAAMYRSDRANGLVTAKSVLIITHIMDPDVFSLVEEYLEVERSITIVFSHAGYDPDERRETRDFFYRLRQKGADIIEVEGSASIVEDLERNRYVGIV